MTVREPSSSLRSRTGAWYEPRPGRRSAGRVRRTTRRGHRRRRRILGRGRGALRLVPRAAEHDRGERNPDLAERLDRDEEAGEEEQHGQELPDLEVVRDAEPVQGVAATGEEPADRDQD